MWQNNDDIYYGNKIVDERVMNVIVIYVSKRKKQLCKKIYMAKRLLIYNILASAIICIYLATKLSDNIFKL